MLHQIKAPQFYTDLGLCKTVLNPLANGKFKDFSRPLSVFQVLYKANFQANSPVYSSTFQACANPVYQLSHGGFLSCNISFTSKLR